MKMLALVVVALLGCSKKEGSSTATGSGSAAAPAAAPAEPAAPIEDVNCRDASKEYAKKMAATPGNVLSDSKPDDSLISWTALSMRDYCDGEDGLVVAWTPRERACVKAAAMTAAAVSACFTGASLAQVNAGLQEVVTDAHVRRKRNAENSAGSAAGSAEKPE